ncbi:sialin isoform X2 [Nematostella vectensis]|uniref:sialin isoform X2 n=1 Tax=Nematostella vectensis TaxID=45351 RepID=UPI0020778F81|nr:sialin isoform X2 [Nematostella vectensis]
MPQSKCSLPCRYILAVLGCFGLTVAFSLRVNLSVALVAMEDDFSWDQETRGIILGSFFYGYIVMLIPGGWLAERNGGKHFVGLGVLISSVLSLLTPLAARYSYKMLIVLRILEGLAQGVIYPSLNVLLSCWAPPEERSKMLVITWTGCQAGNIIGLVVSGLLCASRFQWPSVFYLFGASGIVWYLFWCFLVYDSPSVHPRISLEEKEFIVTAIGASQDKVVKKHPTPWRQILTSRTVLAISLSFFCSNWGFNTFLTSLPTYFQEVLHFNIEENGFLSALPYFCQFFTSLPAGFLADWLIHSHIITVTEVRKIFTLASFLCTACIMVALSFTNHPVVAVTLLCVLFMFQSIDTCGHWISPMEFAPRYCGLLFAIANSFATSTGIVAPFVVGYLTNNQPTRDQWQKVYYIGAGIYVFGAVAFAALGTSKEQPWNTPPEENLVPVDLPHEIRDSHGSRDLHGPRDHVGLRRKTRVYKTSQEKSFDDRDGSLVINA